MMTVYGGKKKRERDEESCTSNRVVVQLQCLDRRLLSVMASFKQRPEKSEDD